MDEMQIQHKIAQRAIKTRATYYIYIYIYTPIRSISHAARDHMLPACSANALDSGDHVRFIARVE